MKNVICENAFDKATKHDFVTTINFCYAFFLARPMPQAAV